MSSSTNSQAVEHIVTNSQTLLTINMTNVTKLTSSNYLMWSLQIHALLDGYDLAGHLDGTTAAPVATITTDDRRQLCFHLVEASGQTDL